jgi:hypothetical protein
LGWVSQHALRMKSRGGGCTPEPRPPCGTAWVKVAPLHTGPVERLRGFEGNAFGRCRGPLRSRERLSQRRDLQVLIDLRSQRRHDSNRHTRGTTPPYARCNSATRAVQLRHTRGTTPPHARYNSAIRAVQLRHTRLTTRSF